jgi:hypothetical protein
MIDVEFVWTELLENAGNVETALVAWKVFILQEGQEHWRCSCGRPVAELFRSTTIQVVE